MFTIVSHPARDFRRAQLLLTTALIGLVPLMLVPGAGFAQAYLDDVTGDDVIDPSPSVTWGADSEIWKYPDDPHSLLAEGDVGILTKPGGGVVEVTIDGTVRPGGLTVESGEFSLSGGVIAATGADDEVRFDVAEGLTLTIDSALNGAMRISGPGTTHYMGESPDMTRLQVDSAANFHSDGNTSGEMQIDGSARLDGEHSGDVTVSGGGRLSGTGEIAGTVENAGDAMLGGSTGAFLNSGDLKLDGALDVLRLVNAVGGEVSVGEGDILASGEAVLNEGQMAVAGQIAASVGNRTGASLTLYGGEIDGSLTNAGVLSGTGDITGALTNSGTATISGSTGDAVNSGTLTTDGNLTVTSLTNDGQAVISAGDVLTAAGGATNNANLQLQGTLAGNLGNDTGGHVDLAAGSGIAGDVTNRGTLSGQTAITGALTNSGTATISGSTGDAVNSGTLTTDGNLTVTSLTNGAAGEVTIGDTDRLRSAGNVDNTGQIAVQGALEVTGADAAVNNRGGGNISLDGARIIGNLVNAVGALIEIGSGSTVQGDLSNHGDIDMTSDSEGVRLSVTAGTFTNSGRVRVSGAGSLVIEADQIALELGSDIDGSRVTLIGTVANQGNLAYAEDAVLNGNLINGEDGHVRVSADLDAAGHDVNNRGSFVVDSDADSTGHLRNVGALTNSGSFAVAGDSTVSAGSAVNSAGGNMMIAGLLTADLTNRDDGTVVLSDGEIVGNVGNAGELRGSGVIGGTLDNSGTVTIGAGDRLQSTGPVRNGGLITVDGTFDSNVANNLEGVLSVGGALAGNLTNDGQYNQTGVLEGSLVTRGAATLAGQITGNLDYAGGEMSLAGDLTVGGTFTLSGELSLTNGFGLSAARTDVTRDGRLDLEGQLGGHLLNSGTINALGNQGSVSGHLVNNGLVSLGEDGRADSLLQVGGLSGNGSYLLDLDLDALAADRIVVQGGATTGQINLAFRTVAGAPDAWSGQRITLLEVDQNFRAANDFRYSYDLTGIPTGRMVFSVDRSIEVGSLGNLELVAQTSPGIGALFGNVVLTQSLIGSVLNRPTSPFVTGLAYEDQENPCGLGAWGRATGGNATATGATDNGVSNIESTIHAHYYGIQAGGDLACSDDRFGGWNMAFGVIGGVNQGDTSQPVHAIDPNNSQAITDRVISTTTADFTQAYGGVYATATRGRFQADLQYRYETTDFTIRNRAVPGAGGALGLNDADFTSTAHTVSGSVGYGIPLGEGGWAVIPTAGFAWSRLDTDSILFDEGYRLGFEDSERQIGFVGTTVARSFVQPARNEALYAFATGTFYKDFADATVSVFSHDNDPDFEQQRLVSDHLGSYGELSIGANYIKVLSGNARGRQFSSSARIDARFGGGLDSVGVTGQLRWQF